MIRRRVALRTTSRRAVSLPTVALVSAVGMSLLAGCAVGGDDDEATRTLTVFAAASLTGAFTKIAEQFEDANPGVDVRLSFDGSSGLVDQIAGGAPADVFASADETTMGRAVDEGLIGAGPQVFATNTLTLITPPGNPAGITGLDHSLDGSRVVVCAVSVPCGHATHELAAAAGIDLRPVSEETSVTDVRGTVASGEADAGIVYRTDALSAGDEVRTVPIADADAVPNRYPLVVVTGAADPVLAQQFVDTVAGTEGRAVLADFGFGPP